MACAKELFGLCLIEAVGHPGDAFFGFAEFVGAFALLAIVFTIANVQYQFRISVSPIPLHKLTFWLIVVIGFGTLGTDLWVSERWLVLYVPGMTFGMIQGLFASCFLLIALTWIYFAFLSPPRFSRWNAARYGQALFNYLLKGSYSELPIIASELGRSTEELVRAFDENRDKYPEQRKQAESGEAIHLNPGNYAVDILSMIGNRKFCRHVVESAPSTIIMLFQSAAKRKCYDIPMKQFAKNISAEAILNTDSNIYHEDNEYRSGLFGVLKPFSQAVYGCYPLVEGLGQQMGSPLDIDYRVKKSWDAQQYQAYFQAVLTTYADRLERGNYYDHSYSLQRATDEFESVCGDVYKLDGVEHDGDPDISERLRVCVDFIEKLIKLLEEHEGKIRVTRLKPNTDTFQRDIHDRVAKIMSKIIYNVSGITKPWQPCWHLQHNTVWSQFFGHQQSDTRKIIAFKLRRLIYEEVIVFDKYEDQKSFVAARYLGISLNCLGLKLRDGRSYETALHKSILRWTKKHFLELHKNHPTVANACLMGGMTYDAEKNRLVKTYAERADRAPDKEYLTLD